MDAGWIAGRFGLLFDDGDDGGLGLRRDDRLMYIMYGRPQV